jgi:hypothetical protein
MKKDRKSVRIKFKVADLPALAEAVAYILNHREVMEDWDWRTTDFQMLERCHDRIQNEVEE